MSSSSKDIDNEIARLMRDPNALRSERGQGAGGRGHYDPNQPRVPGGSENGGQWTSRGHHGGRSSRDAVKPVQVGFELAHHPVPPGWENDGHFGNVGMAIPKE